MFIISITMKMHDASMYNVNKDFNVKTIKMKIYVKPSDEWNVLFWVK